ncbi:MAG: hypothetical protein J6X60_12350, partial [Ruminiclostridium sp.]|nr:hypothetical protein [Ruminiclostridium sp.]
MISADMTKSTVAKRMIQLILLILLLCAAAQIIFVGPVGAPDAENSDLGSTITYVYDKGKMISGGGVAGLVIGAPLLLFGQVGAIIILILISFVAVMLITDKSLGDLFGIFRKPAEKIKEHHDRVTEEREIIKPELEQLEEQRRAQRSEERERRIAEKKAKRAEHELTAEEKRKNKFASIANVTTSAQQEVSEEEKKEAKLKEKEVEPPKDPIIEQKKESNVFQKDLHEYLNVRYDNKGLSPNKAFPSDDKPAEPYRPDAPMFADGSGCEDIPEKHLNPVIKHDSLIESHPVHISSENTSSYSDADSSEDEPPFDVDKPEDNTSAQETDIAEAIKDFRREQEERAAAAENNARVLDTVIKEDEHGQQHLSELVSEGDNYTLPPLELLNDIIHDRSDTDINEEIQHNAATLVETLKSFGVEANFLEAVRGPSVTRYELQPAPGVKISKITGLVDDLAVRLDTVGVRIEAPIPGKAAVGIEVPN